MRYRFLRFPDGKFKAVTFSYDDGCRADIRLSKLFSSYGLKGTFNLNSNWLGKTSEDWRLTADEINEHIISKGHEIAVHGAEHKANGNIRPIEGILDVSKCRVELENIFDMIIRGMAYPDTGICQFNNGTTMDDIEAYLKALDIVYSRTLGGKNEFFELPQNWYKWLPNAHHDHPDVFNLIDKFVGLEVPKSLPKGSPKLFYLWGHAYEFDKNDNWDRIKNICQKLSGKEDTWYATNIEIYDYVKAYMSLLYSADSKRIYNPTNTQVWFVADGEVYTIKPGETLKI